MKYVENISNQCLVKKFMCATEGQLCRTLLALTLSKYLSGTTEWPTLGLFVSSYSVGNSFVGATCPRRISLCEKGSKQCLIAGNNTIVVQ